MRMDLQEVVESLVYLHKLTNLLLQMFGLQSLDKMRISDMVEIQILSQIVMILTQELEKISILQQHCIWEIR
jgi:hypothetical protein